MKIAKKLTKVLVVIIVVVTLATLGWYLYQEQTDKVDQVVALECPHVQVVAEDYKDIKKERVKVETQFGEAYPVEMISVSYIYYMLESSKASRDTVNFYKNIYTIQSDFAVPLLDEDLEKFKSEQSYYVDEKFISVRSLKYIHLFNNPPMALKYLEKQSEIPAPKELVEMARYDSWKGFDAYLPYYSFNRETLEKTHWSRELNANLFEIKPVLQQCKEVDASIPLNLVKQNIEKASSGEKKI